MLIQGRTISLRPIGETDLCYFYNQFAQIQLQMDSLLTKSISYVAFEKKYFEKGFWDDPEGIVLIENKEEKIVGAIWYEKTRHINAFDLEYVIFSTQNRGKGYMSEALSLFSAYLFASHNLSRLQLSIPDYHRASMAVAKKCGYTFEGIARHGLYTRGKYADLCLYSLLKEECKHIDNLYQ